MNGKYYLLGSLGKSQSGNSKVYLAQEIDNPRAKVAVKVISSALAKDDLKKILHDFEVHKKLKNINLAKVISYGKKGSIQKKNKVKNEITYIVMQFLEGGSFLDFQDLIGGQLTELEAKFFIRQVL